MPVTGSYDFTQWSDDFGAMWIDNKLVTTSNYNIGYGTTFGTVVLSAGPHQIDIGFNEGGGGYGIASGYRTTGSSTFSYLPSSMLSYGGLTSTYANLGGLSGSGTVTLAGAALNLGISNDSSTFSGSIQGRGYSAAGSSYSGMAVIKVGSGTQTLTGVSTYTEKTLVNYGELRLADGGKLAAPATPTDDQLKVLSGGTFTLDNTGTNLSSRITGATTKFGVTLAGGKFSLLGNSSAATSQSLGDLTLSSGASTLEILPGAGQTVTLNFESLKNRVTGATLNISTTVPLADDETPAPYLTFTTPPVYGLGLLNGVIVTRWDDAHVLTPDFALYDSAYPSRGVYPMSPAASGVDSYRNITSLSPDLVTDNFNSVAAGVNAVNPSSDSVIVVSGLKLDSGSNVTLSGATNQMLLIANPLGPDASGGIIKTGTGGASVIGGGTSTTAELQSQGNELFVYVRDPGVDGSLTINATIYGSGANLVKSGSGTLVLGAANSYSGTTFINEGTLQYGVADAIPSVPGAQGVQINGRNAVLDLNGRINSASSIGPMIVNGGSFINSGSGGSLRIDALTIGGPAGSSPSLNLGTATLSLAGNVTYDATNNPNTATIAGNLDLLALNQIFTVGDSTASGAATDLFISAVISNSGSTVTKAGAGNLRLSANNTFDANVNVTAGVLTVSNDLSLGSGTKTTTVSTGATLALYGGVTIPSTMTYSVSGIGSSNAALTTAGAIVSLNDENILQGAVSLTGDVTLAANSGASLVLAGEITRTGTSAVVTLAGQGDFELSGTLGSSSITRLGPLGEREQRVDHLEHGDGQFVQRSDQHQRRHVADGRRLGIDDGHQRPGGHFGRLGDWRRRHIGS